MEATGMKKGLNGFQLKYLALILMVFDHIHYFFEYTGHIPVWFSMLGRLSAPLFLFIMVEGYTHTHDRKKYFIRIFFVSAGMGIIQFLMKMGLFVRRDGFYPNNQIFANFVLLIVIFHGIDLCRKKCFGKGLAFILVPMVLPFAVVLGLNRFPMDNPAVMALWNILNLIHQSVFPFHFWILDGGTYFILEGILLYLFQKNRKIQCFVYSIFYILVYGVRLLVVVGFDFQIWFLQAYEWMGVFAVIFMLLYNGQRGKGSKTFFYFFYPLHVYLLYLLSCILISR